jgi:two-component system, NarL family, sensor histidine kinase UhpB
VLLYTLANTPDAVPPEARPALAATHATIRQITESVARLVRDYHPAELLGLGLEDTVRTHAHEFARRHDLGLRLSTSAVGGLLSPEHELHLYRIVQEALANVARHAAARNVTLRLSRERRCVTASVRDDGVGFAPGTACATGLGLVTMRERAELMGATLLIRGRRDRGTEIHVSVPISNAQSAGAAPVASAVITPRRARAASRTVRAGARSRRA